MLKLLLIILTSTCMSSKANSQSISLKNVQISWLRFQNSTDSSDVTRFSVSTPLNGIQITDAWVGVGLSNGQRMDGAQVFVCRNSPESQWVKHYYTSGFQLLLKDNNNPAIGIIDSSVSTNASNLICIFRVDNKKSFLSPQVDFTNPYVLIAFGTGLGFVFLII